MQIQISCLLQKPTDLDLHCLQNRVYSGSAGQGLKYPALENKHFGEKFDQNWLRDKKVFDISYKREHLHHHFEYLI